MTSLESSSSIYTESIPDTPELLECSRTLCATLLNQSLFTITYLICCIISVNLSSVHLYRLGTELDTVLLLYCKSHSYNTPPAVQTLGSDTNIRYL